MHDDEDPTRPISREDINRIMPSYEQEVDGMFRDIASYLGQLQGEIEPEVTYYLGLNTPMEHEVRGRGYRRQPIRFSVRPDGSKISVTPQVFKNLPKVFVSRVSVWSAQRGGVRVWSGHTLVPLNIQEGQDVFFEMGSINAV